MNRHYLPVTLLVTVLATLGCGDDGDNGSSGSAGTGGSGGVGGEAGVGGATGGTGGGAVEPAKMVQLPGGFWIDSTEVTRAQYQAWLDSTPSVASLPSECSWKTDFTPGCHWPVGSEPDHPVSCVDWCDAYAYCQGVGKRLCGKIGGGAAAVEDHDDATKSQWYYACSSGGLYEYPYGNEYDPQACNIEDSLLREAAEVSSFQSCQSSTQGFAGVFDMCGNVSEWADACEAEEGGIGACVQHDGSFASSAVAARCRLAAAWSMDERSDGLGFRCCRD
jgi:sulfatase modifying factor 1